MNFSQNLNVHEIFSNHYEPGRITKQNMKNKINQHERSTVAYKRYIKCYKTYKVVKTRKSTKVKRNMVLKMMLLCEKYVRYRAFSVNSIVSIVVEINRDIFIIRILVDYSLLLHVIFRRNGYKRRHVKIDISLIKWINVTVRVENSPRKNSQFFLLGIRNSSGLPSGQSAFCNHTYHKQPNWVCIYMCVVWEE